jgi:hypothetical protein
MAMRQSDGRVLLQLDVFREKSKLQGDDQMSCLYGSKSKGETVRSFSHIARELCDSRRLTSLHT